MIRTDRWVSEAERHRRCIDEQGWSVVTVGGGGRRALPFAHTVGLARLGHPELLVSGRGACEAEYLLNCLGDEVAAGARFHIGDLLRRASWPTMRLLRVTTPGALSMVEILGERATGEVAALQVVWCDADGRWPWDPAWPGSARRQQLFAAAPRVAAPRLLP